VSVAQESENARQNEAKPLSRVFLFKFDDGVEVVVRAHELTNACALAYRARANDKTAPRIVNVEAKKWGPGRIVPRPPDAHASRRLGQRCAIQR
jgi:hypothetical protein